MYKLKFEHDRYTVKATGNGKDWLQLIRSFWPDVVLVDLMMPEMNGEEMLLELRAQKWGKDFKIVVLTNTSRQEAPPSLNNLGISHYVVKAEQTPAQVEEIVRDILTNQPK